MLVAYNVSSDARSDRVVVDATLHRAGDKLTYLYGGGGTVDVEDAPDGSRYVKLDLPGKRFAILA